MAAETVDIPCFLLNMGFKEFAVDKKTEDSLARSPFYAAVAALNAASSSDKLVQLLLPLQCLKRTLGKLGVVDEDDEEETAEETEAKMSSRTRTWIARQDAQSENTALLPIRTNDRLLEEPGALPEQHLLRVKNVRTQQVGLFFSVSL